MLSEDRVEEIRLRNSMRRMGVAPSEYVAKTAMEDVDILLDDRAEMVARLRKREDENIRMKGRLAGYARGESILVDDEKEQLKADQAVLAAEAGRLKAEVGRLNLAVDVLTSSRAVLAAEAGRHRAAVATLAGACREAREKLEGQALEIRQHDHHSIANRVAWANCILRDALAAAEPRPAGEMEGGRRC